MLIGDERRRGSAAMRAARAVRPAAGRLQKQAVRGVAAAQRRGGPETREPRG